MNNKMNHPLITVDGRTLMDRPLEPPNFVVDTLISQGLHILAGSPKVGKSWLALWLAVMVAKGEPVWGMSVRQGTTLYLCLEDSVLRIQNRLFEITEDAPDSVHFCTECAPIGQGLEEQVETFLAAHSDTVLVIIDTLQMVRPVHDATYANDYRDLSVLKRLADKHGIAILLIHHLRKEKAEDPAPAGDHGGYGGLADHLVRLGRSLERGPGADPVMDSTTMHRHSDRKILRREQEKKIALGHKEDDHEEEQILQQTM